MFLCMYIYCYIIRLNIYILPYFFSTSVTERYFEVQSVLCVTSILFHLKSSAFALVTGLLYLETISCNPCILNSIIDPHSLFKCLLGRTFQSLYGSEIFTAFMRSWALIIVGNPAGCVCLVSPGRPL